MQTHYCFLCRSKMARSWKVVHQRRYFLCDGCGYVFVDPDLRLKQEEEHERYKNHNNNAEDPGYRKFLSKMAEPISAYLKPGSQGLDYGCGPGPTLSKILQEKGFVTADYDPFFFPQEELLSHSYDFIVSTEVFEHMHDPGQEIDRITSMLRNGGILGVMTSFVPADFESWYYLRDETHVGFFSRKTFDYIARHWGYRLLEATDKIAILRYLGSVVL